MPGRGTVGGAVAVALAAAAGLRLLGWPGWATLVAFVVLVAAFVATEVGPGREDPAEPERSVERGMIEPHEEEARR
jgi:hypothetical protein